MKQTSIDWLFEKLCKNKDINIALKSNFYTATKVFEQAKEMEKQQIIDAYKQGQFEFDGDLIRESHAEDYYNETFKP